MTECGVCMRLKEGGREWLGVGRCTCVLVVQMFAIAGAWWEMICTKIV